MNHEMVDGNIHVLKADSSCEFHVKCSDCLDERTLHNDLTVFLSGKPPTSPVYVGDYVAVTDSTQSKRFMRRGRIIEINDVTNTCKVELMDDARVITVATDDEMFLLSNYPSWNYQPQHHRIGLFGVVPNQKGTNNGMKQVEQYLQEMECSFKTTKVANDVFYGSITVDVLAPDGKLTSYDLTQRLVQMKRVVMLTDFVQVLNSRSKYYIPEVLQVLDENERPKGEFDYGESPVEVRGRGVLFPHKRRSFPLPHRKSEDPDLAEQNELFRDFSTVPDRSVNSEITGNPLVTNNDSDGTSEEIFFDGNDSSEEIFHDAEEPEVEPQTQLLNLEKTVVCFPQVEPISDLIEFPMNEPVYLSYSCLNNEGTLTPSQAHVLRALKEKNNLILVGPPSSKTTTCLVAVVNHIFNHKALELQKSDSDSEINCVILAPNDRIMYIRDLCLFLCSHLFEVKVFCNGQTATHKAFVNCNCDILITSPKNWFRLMSLDPMSKLNVRHVMFDSADALVHSSPVEVSKLVKKFGQMTSDSDFFCQIIVVANIWRHEFLDISKIIKGRRIHLFCDLLTAGPFCGLCMDMITTTNKTDYLLACLKDSKFMEKRVIVVCQPEDVRKLRPVLGNQKGVFISDNFTPSNKFYEIEKFLYRRSNYVFVCTHDLLRSLAIVDTEWLIIYSYSVDKSFFNQALACLKNFMDHKQREGRVTVLIDDWVPEFTRLLNNYSSKLQNLEYLEKLENQYKAKWPLCDNILRFGICRRYRNCPWRHTLDPNLDKITTNVEKGYVEVEVLYAISPIEYAVRPIAQSKTPNKGNWTEVKNEYDVNFEKKMKEYYKDEANREKPTFVEIGDIYGYKKEITYVRVQVVLVEVWDGVDVAAVKFYDLGGHSVIEMKDLLSLSEELTLVPPQLSRIIITGLQPGDLEESWSEDTLIKVNGFLDETMSSLCWKKILIGQVIFSVCDSIFVDSLYSKDTLGDLQTFDLKKFLLHNKLAQENFNHLNELKIQSINLGIDIGRFDFSSDVHQFNPVKPQWAKLPADTYSLVTVVHILHPSAFFVRNTNTSAQLSALNVKLVATVGELGCLKHIFPGIVCLAQNPSTKTWQRAMVQVVNGDKADVFFVDEGSSCDLPTSSLYPILRSLIEELPFQAIECSLAGVKITDSVLSPRNARSTQKFAELTKDGNLFCAVHAENAGLLTGRSFEVSLILQEPMEIIGLSKKEHIVNCLMISSLCARWGDRGRRVFKKIEEDIETNSLTESEETEGVGLVSLVLT